MASAKELEILLEHFVVVKSQEGGYILDGILIITPPEDSRAYTIINGEIKVDDKYKFSLLHDDTSSRTGLGYRLINPDNVDKIIAPPSRPPILIVENWIYGGGFIQPSEQGEQRRIGFAGDSILEARTSPYKIWTETTQKYCTDLFEAHMKFKRHLGDETKAKKDGVFGRSGKPFKLK